MCIWSSIVFLSGSVSPPMQFMEDAKLLSESLTGIFMGTVQYNQPRRASDERSVSNYSTNVDDTTLSMCSHG